MYHCHVDNIDTNIVERATAFAVKYANIKFRENPFCPQVVTNKQIVVTIVSTCLQLAVGSEHRPVCVQVELLETVTSALVCLLQAQPSLADQVPSLGHIPQLCKQMATHHQQGAVIRATVLLLHQLATSEVHILQASHSVYLLIYLFIYLCIHVGVYVVDMGEKCMLSLQWKISSLERPRWENNMVWTRCSRHRIGSSHVLLMTSLWTLGFP